LARRRSPGFLTGRKRSVQARITGSGSHVPEPGGISGYEKIRLPKTGSLCWRSPPGRRVNFFTRTAAVPWPEPVAERASNLPPCWSSGVRRRAGFSRGLRGSCCPQPACPAQTHQIDLVGGNIVLRSQVLDDRVRAPLAQAVVVL